MIATNFINPIKIIMFLSFVFPTVLLANSEFNLKKRNQDCVKLLSYKDHLFFTLIKDWEKI